MVTEMFNGPVAPPLPFEVRIAVPSPSSAQGGTARARISATSSVSLDAFNISCLLRSGINALCDRPQQGLRPSSRLASVEVSDVPDLDAHRLSLAVPTQVALNHKRFCSLAHHHKETR